MPYANINVAKLAVDVNKTRPVYGAITVTQSDTGDTNTANQIAVLSHPSGTDVLNPPSSPVVAGPGPFNGYYKLTGYVAEAPLKEVIVVNGELIVPVHALYKSTAAWAGFRHTANNVTVAFVFGLEQGGQIFFSQRPTTGYQAAVGVLTNIAGGGKLEALAGAKVSVWVASNKSGTLTLGNSNISIEMIEDLT
tara:strand:+ start:2511 stop:3089 length:579 start_codon:yes stop_codon:yes gene_type:complete